MCIYIYMYIYSLSLPPPRPHQQACPKLRSPVGLLKINVHTTFCCREMASEPNIFKRDGASLSSGNSTLMQRERGKKEAKAGKREQRFGGSVRSVGRHAGIGRGGPSIGRGPVGKSRQTTVGRRQRGSKLNNKQESAKGKAQEV